MNDHNEANFFGTPAELRVWLEKHYATETEAWVGSYRKSAGRQCLTWQQIVDEVLCFGWIDGLRRGMPEERWAIRITPRRRDSNWSAVNVRRVPELVAEGRMTEAGLRAFDARDTSRTPYSYEARTTAFDDETEARLSADPVAWAWFSAQPASYRRLATHWVMTAKRSETRERRLQMLIDDSANERRIKPLAYGREPQKRTERVATPLEESGRSAEGG